MKKHLPHHFIAGCSILLCLFLTVSIYQPLSAQQTFTFTTCGATGLNGPTQGQVNSTYTGANLLTGQVTISGQGIQQWTVPGGGAYKIEAWGAQGGKATYYPADIPGSGAYVSGEFNLTAGTVLKIAVGQMGSQTSDTRGAGGGGGSFVADASNNVLLVAGGGAGTGGGFINPDKDGVITTAAKPGNGGGGCAGVSGNGGTNCGTMAGACGGGFYTDGANSANRPTALGGKAFVNGAQGGVNEGSTVGSGGFGGGGGGANNCGYGGGGGGYSGGGGAGYATTCGGNGGGGGSINNGTNQTNLPGVCAGDGTVIITRLCNVDLQATKNPICLGESIALSTNAVSNVVWGHTGSTSNTVNVSPSTNTTYSVTGQAATGCTTSIVLTVTVNPLPNLSAAVVPSVLCVGKTATLTASGANSYTWTSLSISAPSATANPAATTSYNYSGTNQYGCVSSTVVSVNVNTNSVSLTPNTTICEGQSITLTAGNAVTYTWSTGNNFPSTPVAPITNTTYMVSGTDIHNCVTSNVVNISVDNKPNVSASASKNTICKGESVNLMASGASTYTWSSAAGTGAQVTISPPVDVVYNYTVTGTASNGCTNTAVVAVTVSRCSGLSKLNSAAIASRVYPNPASSEVIVETGAGLLNTIEVTDLTGRTVMLLVTKEQSTKVNLDKLSNGVYYFRISSSENVDVVRVVKNN